MSQPSRLRRFMNRAGLLVATGALAGALVGCGGSEVASGNANVGQEQGADIIQTAIVENRAIAADERVKSFVVVGIGKDNHLYAFACGESTDFSVKARYEDNKALGEDFREVGKTIQSPGVGQCSKVEKLTDGKRNKLMEPSDGMYFHSAIVKLPGANKDPEIFKNVSWKYIGDGDILNTDYSKQALGALPDLQKGPAPRDNHPKAGEDQVGPYEFPAGFYKMWKPQLDGAPWKPTAVSAPPTPGH